MHPRPTQTTATAVAVRTQRAPAMAGLSRWLPLGLLGAAQFMLIIDVTVVNVALPSIGRALGLDRAALTWVVIAYTLFFGSLLLLGGRLADVFGRRRIFLAGLGLFIFASLTSGLAPDGAILVIGRALQGVGAALLSPAALSILTTTFQGPDRTRALAAWAALGGSGAAIGVVLGGVLAAGPGWQWIFFVNVPIGILVALGVRRIIPALAPEQPAGAIDVPGAVLVVPAVGLVLLALIGAGDTGWLALSTLVPLAVAVVLLAAFASRERGARAPLVKLEMFGQRTLSGGLFVVVAASALLAGAFFLVSLYVQRMVGLTPLETGLLFLPVALAIIVGSQVGSALLGHAGGRATATAGLVAVGIGMALLARAPGQANALIDVLPAFGLAGLGLGATLVAAMTTAFVDVPSEDSGLASGLVNTSHELGFAIGVSLLSAVAGASLAGGQEVGGFSAAFIAAAVIAIASAIATVRLLPGDSYGPRRAHAH